MTINLNPQAQQEAIASLERYYSERLDERLGNVAARGLLDFFLAEIGPAIYNQAVADVQKHLGAKIMELDLDVYEDEFPYWRNSERGSAKKK